MNPFRLGGALPRHPWLRLGLGLLGLALLGWVARNVDWHQLRLIFSTLQWPWVLASVIMAGFAVTVRALRMAWILELRGRFGAVWNALALGYLGRVVLPLGGGEILRIGALRSLLGIPAATAAAAAVLDRLFDLLGLGLLLAMLASAGAMVHLRRSAVVAALVAMAFLALGATLILRGDFPRGGWASSPSLARFVEPIARVLGSLRRPAHLGRLLAVQGLASALDVAGIWIGLKAFAFGGALPALVSVKLTAFISLGAALPLLPGGAGTLQVACALALQPAGVSAAGAFAYSLMAQGTGLVFACLLGGAAALSPAPPVRT